MGRVLAFDYGMKRVGLAVSDPLKLIANTLETVGNKELFEFVKGYCLKEDVECFAVGFPYNYGHEERENDIKPKIEKFIAELQKLYPNKPVHKVDERFTSKIASMTLHQSGVNRKEKHRKENIDAISANLILQAYLEMASNG